MSKQKRTYPTYQCELDHRTETPGVYRRGRLYRVTTRPNGKRKVMHSFATYEEAVAFKATLPKRTPRPPKPPRSSQPARPVRARRSSAVNFLDVLRIDPCAYCGGAGGVIDHIYPRALGGSDEWTNLTAACAQCNNQKKAKLLLTYLAHRNGCWVWRHDNDKTPPQVTRRTVMDPDPITALLEGGGA